MVQHSRAAFEIWNRGLSWEVSDGACQLFMGCRGGFNVHARLALKSQSFIEATRKEYAMGEWGKNGGLHAWYVPFIYLR